MSSNEPLIFLERPPKASLSQEEESLKCPFGRASQHSLSSSESHSLSPPEDGIIMESPPDSDFLTPPEHHPTPPLSNADGLEAESTVDLGFQGEKGCDCVIKDHPMELVPTTALHENVGREIVLKNVTDKLDSGTEEVTEYVEMEVVSSALHENGLSGREIVLQKPGGGVGSDARTDQITQNLEMGAEIVSEEVTEKLDMGAKSSQETVNVDMEVLHLNSEETVVLDLDKQKVLGDGGDGDLDEEQCDSIVRPIVTKVGCQSDKIGALDRELMSEKVRDLKLGSLGVGNGFVEDIESTDDTDMILDSEEHAQESTLNNENLVLDSVEKDTSERDEVSERKLLNGNVGDVEGLHVLSRGENELVVGQRAGGSGHKEDVSLQTRGKRKMQGSRKSYLGKSKEGTDKFKHAKLSDDAQRVSGETVPVEGNVPLPNTEKGPPSELGQDSFTKEDNIRFMNMVNRAAELLKRDVDPDIPELNLIEILEKKGSKFPLQVGGHRRVSNDSV